MGYVQDIFRGLLEDPCPFGNIPIHSHFDNIAGVHNPRSSHSTSPVSLGPDIDLTSETEFNNSNPTPFSISGLISPIIHPSEATTVDRSRIEERTQKRLSRGVSNISMPPPLKFSRPTVSPGGLSKNQKERHHKPIGEQEPTESLELAPITVGSVTLDEEDILSSPDGSSRRGRSREALETVITD